MGDDFTVKTCCQFEEHYLGKPTALALVKLLNILLGLNVLLLSSRKIKQSFSVMAQGTVWAEGIS